MSDQLTALLDSIPEPVEVRRRALVLGRLSGVPVEPMVDGEVIGWQNGAGDWVAWVVAGDGSDGSSGGVLGLVLDHESDLNLYPDHEVEAQHRMYAGVPDDLVERVRGLPDGELFTMMGTGDTALPLASGIVWFSGEQWHAADGLLALTSERDLDPVLDSGLGFCLAPYRFGELFTVDTVLGMDPQARGGLDEQQVRDVFAEVSG